MQRASGGRPDRKDVTYQRTESKLGLAGAKFMERTK